MFEPVTAVNHAKYTAGIARITEIGPIGMITLRGDLSNRGLQDAAARAGGVDLPDQRRCTLKGDNGIAWMSPDEILIMCPYAEVSDRIAHINTGLDGRHILAVNVSDARAVFEVDGPAAREVMGKLAPVDLSPDAFVPGMFRRTRMAQVPAAFWLHEPDCFRVVCFRSVGQYMFDLLKVAAQPGSDVGYYSA